MQRFGSILRPVIALAAVLALASCGDGGTEPSGDQPGTFRMSVAGDFTEDLRGDRAIAGVVCCTGYWIQLRQPVDGVTRGAQIMLNLGSRPAPGQYFAQTIIFGDGGASYNSVGNRVTITESTAEGVKGEFDFSAEHHANPNRKISGSGRFHAKVVDE